MNTNQKGKITELEILTYVIKNGYSVSLPYGDKDRYDQIWDINGELYKIQIKTSHWKNEDKLAITFKCRSTFNGMDHKYTKEEIDFFATYWENECYVVPVEECSLEKTLWFAPPKNGFKNCCYAKDYLFKEIIK